MNQVLILNPAAGAFRRDPGALDRLERQIGGRARVVRSQSLAELETALDQLDPSECEWIGLVGGDGTFMTVLSELLHRFPEGLPPLALLPAGTVNTAAHRCGMPGPVGKAVEALLRDGSAQHRQHRQPTLKVLADGNARFGFTFGTGLVARFFQHYERLGSRGLGAAARIFARVFAGSFVGSRYAKGILDPLPCELRVDGKLAPPEAFSLIVCSVFKDVGMGLKITYRANDCPGRLHLVASSLPAHRLGPQAPRVLLGRPLRGEHHVDEHVGEFEIYFPTGAGPFVLDGEGFEAHRIRIRPGPSVVLLTQR